MHILVLVMVFYKSSSFSSLPYFLCSFSSTECKISKDLSLSSLLFCLIESYVEVLYCLLSFHSLYSSVPEFPFGSFYFYLFVKLLVLVMYCFLDFVAWLNCVLLYLTNFFKPTILTLCRAVHLYPFLWNWLLEIYYVPLVASCVLEFFLCSL